MREPWRRYLEEGERAGMRYAMTLPTDVASGLAGVHLGHKTGSSVDFKDYREYQPGDDLRHIDWNVYARSDKLVLKLFREEVSPHVDILLDGSRSMALQDTAKARALLGLAAVFASAAGNAKCTHTAWSVAADIRRVGNGTSRPGVWDGIELDFEGDPSDSFALALPGWRRKGIRVLISDLFWRGDPVPVLRRLAEDAAAVVVVQLLADADVNPPPQGNTRLEDVETGERFEVFLDAAARKRYTAALTTHQHNWHRACRQAGAVIATAVAEQIVGDWQLDALEATQILLTNNA
ncbi:MAG: DUF58 domain-containing protein [Kiritimatiellae bacterium]|nr:DUF58 domain-containing protein [Kiritimatiellia bacterium]